MRAIFALRVRFAAMSSFLTVTELQRNYPLGCGARGLIFYEAGGRGDSRRVKRRSDRVERGKGRPAGESYPLTYILSSARFHY